VLRRNRNYRYGRSTFIQHDWLLTLKIASIIVSVSGWVVRWRPRSAADCRSSRARWPLRRAGKLEVAMASKPKAARAATTIAGINPGLIFRPCTNTTDPAVGWLDGGRNEFFTQLDKPTQAKAMAVRLEAEANVHKALADAHSQMAQVLKSRG
jgi:hypothetical protein